MRWLNAHSEMLLWENGTKEWKAGQNGETFEVLSAGHHTIILSQTHIYCGFLHWVCTTLVLSTATHLWRGTHEAELVGNDGF